MSAQPNRKQQRLAREISRSDGVPYQTALAKIRAAAQQPTQDADGVVSPQRRMLELMYETFVVAGKWPLFQYVSALWDDVDVEARDVYLDLAEQDLVRPAMTRSHKFQLRQETVVGLSLQGLMYIGSAAEDLDRLVAVVRYIAKSAREFRPSSPTELERLELRSEDVRQHLGLDLGDPSLARLGALLSDEAWQLWTSFGRTESDEWSFEVNLERARRYDDIQSIIDFLEISYPEQYRQQEVPAPVPAPDVHGDDPLPTNRDAGAIHLFISHASEDKDAVARPLAKALEARGWSVWLDELKLTVGDSVSGGIDAALARSRFGVVVLSRSFFAKQWPQRELAGLAAREVDAGSKVILPVWHEVDHGYIVQRSPVLADRVGALTSNGIEQVADELSTALTRAGIRAGDGLAQEPVVLAVEPDDEAKVDRWVAHHPPAEITPQEFEQFVAEVLRASTPGLEQFHVQPHEKIAGTDGVYDFDATVRFVIAGMEFLTVVEAKRHSNPINRELVQVLHSKAQSVGAHKAVVISTAPFQRGAITFAKTHGIALVMVSEGRLGFETRSASPQAPMSKQQAEARGLPTFVGVCFGLGDKPGSTTISTFDPDDGSRIQKLLFGVPMEAEDAD